MKQSMIKVGDFVTVKSSVPAYYSNFPNHYSVGVNFTPGMLGRVSRINVPNVCGGPISFICVDWQHGTRTDAQGVIRPAVHRCGVNYDNVQFAR